VNKNMSLLKIRKYPDPILRGKCQEVKEVTEEIKNLGWNMIETMIENQGIGLAAPQVGELKRIIVVHPIEERSSEEKFKKKPQIFINPKIVKKSKETLIDEEGCLSFPGLFLKIKRSKSVEIEALNERGEKILIRAEGLSARIFQHEIDHLDGILFIDRVSFWQKMKIRKKLKF
jgi:peptide deformylase